MSEALASVLAVALVNATLVIAPALGVSVIVGCAVAPLVCAAALIYMALNLAAFLRSDTVLRRLILLECFLCAAEIALAWWLS